MVDLDRRAFLRTAAALAASTLVPACSCTPPRTRQNVYCLAPDDPVLNAYRAAIVKMRALPATDPLSWSAQAAIHGTLAPLPGMIHDVCQHGTDFFLSWHRMYLYYFERIVRKMSGDPDFALPYWGYSPTGKRSLPEPFRVPADPAANPLFTTERVTSVNAGADLNASTVDAGFALASPIFAGFSSSLEGTPHGVVHTSVGGFTGWMSAFETAALDPIFWLHHANIDRLWEVWLGLGAGNSNPTDPTWLGTSFDFYDENGTTVSLTGQQVVDTARQLGYVYGKTACLNLVDSVILDHLRECCLVALGSPLLAAELLVVAQQTAALALGGSPREIELPLEAPARASLERLSTEAASGRTLVLQLDDIRLEGGPAVYYEVYVDLPAAGPEATYTSSHYAGNLSFFGHAPKEGRAPVLSRRLDMLPVFLRLRKEKLWSEGAVKLTFVPRGPTERDAPAELLGDRRQAEIGRISLRIESISDRGRDPSSH
jgi:tyrosinase